MADINWLAMKSDPTTAKLGDNCGGIIFGRIVDDLDLHQFGAHVLAQDRGQCLTQITRAIVGGDHH
jgi:hypothetical protein